MKIRTLSQILAEGSESIFDFDDLIIEKNFLTKGKTWVISGASGIGKSVLAMQLALGLALGEKHWGLMSLSLPRLSCCTMKIRFLTNAIIFAG